MDGAAGVSPVPLTCEECRESRGRHPRSGTLRERQLQAFREDRTGCAPCPPPITSRTGTQGKCRVRGEPRGGTPPPLVPRRWPSPQLLAAVPSRGAQT